MGVESGITSEEVVKLPSHGHKSEGKNPKQKKLLPASSTPTDLPRSWKIEDSEDLYRIEGWGHPYFSISAAGHITVSPGVNGEALLTCLSWLMPSNSVIWDYLC